MRATVMPGPEISPARVVMAPPAFSQTLPRIAAGGDGYLAIWNDSATVPAGALHATRLAADGTPLDDARPLVVSDAYGQSDVVWDGRRYLVVWTQTEGVFGRFVATDGTMAAPFRISEPAPPSPGGYGFPRVGWSGREFFVAWNDTVGVDFFAAALLDANGRVTRRIDLTGYGSRATWSLLVAVARVNDVFHLVTADVDPATEPPVAEIGMAAIHSDGSIDPRVVLGTMPVRDRYQPVNLQAVSRGSGAMVAWSNEKTTYVLRIGAGAEPLQSFDGDLQVLLADRGGFAIVYDDANGRWVRRAGSAAATPIARLPRRSRAAAGANDLLIVAAGERTDLFAQRLGGDTFTPLTVAPRHQNVPAIAAAGALRLAAWLKVIDDRYAVMAARLGPRGAQLDPDAIELGSAPIEFTHVRIAAGPGQWLVVWFDSNRIVGVRIALDGTALDPEPVVIADPVYYPDKVVAAWDGSRYVVAFLNGAPNRLGGSFAVAAVRLTSGGVVEPPMIQVSPFGPLRAPAIAGSGNGSLVVWTRNDGTLHGALLAQSGTVTPVAFPAQRGPFRERDLDVAWNGRTWLVAAPEPRHIVWFSVSPSGVVTPPAAPAYVTHSSPFTVVLDVEPLGDGFLLVYQNAVGQISAAAINRDGYVAHGPQVVVPSTTVYDPRIGAAGTTIVYARPTDPLRGRLSRVFVKELTIAPDRPRRRAVR